MFKPEASMVSTESTVTALFMPDTVRLAQCPPIVIVLETPLIVTTLSRQTIVLVSLTPEMAMLLDGGAVGEAEGPVVAVGVRLADGAGLLLLELGVREVLGVGEEVPGLGEKAVLPWEPRLTTKAAIPPATASSRTTAMATTIQSARVFERDRCSAYGSP